VGTISGHGCHTRGHRVGLPEACAHQVYLCCLLHLHSDRLFPIPDHLCSSFQDAVLVDAVPYWRSIAAACTDQGRSYPRGRSCACWLVAACAWPQTIPTGDSPQVTLLPPGSTQTPSPTPGTLTDAEAIALAGEELVSRGVDPHTATITIGSEPRRASIRYSSSYSVDGPAFQAQTVLVTLGVSRVMARVQPPIDGGARVAVLPDEEGEVGLRVTVIDGTSLEAWANGSISHQDFVSGWTVGTGTRE